MISDRHAHNKTDVSIHRSVGVRECSISREGQPRPPCQPSPSCRDVEDGECRTASICSANSSHCDEQVFCRDVTEPSVATASISNGKHRHDDDEQVFKRIKTGFCFVFFQGYCANNNNQITIYTFNKQS